MRRERVRDVYAFLALFSLWDGDGVRNALSWWGFSAISFALLIGGIVLLRIERRSAAALLKSWNAVPIGLFVLVCVASAAWSAYPLVTLLALFIQLSTATVAVALLVARPIRRLIAIGAVMLHAHLALALLFELGVALSPAGKLLPLFTDYSANVPGAYYWSQGMLLTGGRIQGIVGNANLTGFNALLALILVVALWRAGAVRTRLALAGGALDLLMLALTRSATVAFSGATVLVSALIVLGYRRFGRRGRGVLVAGGLVAVATVALASSRLSEPLLRVLGRGDDFTGRFEIWRLVGTLVGMRPVGGWGWIGYWAPWVYPYDRLVVRGGVQYLQAHNAYLDVLMQLGIPGIATLALVVGSLVWRSLRLALVPRPLAILPLLLAAALLTQALAESRLLIEGNWALLVQLSLAVPAASLTRARTLSPGLGEAVPVAPA